MTAEIKKLKEMVETKQGILSVNQLYPQRLYNHWYGGETASKKFVV